MAKKRTVDQILNETLPGPSKDIYKKKWDSFKVFFGNKMKPAEADYNHIFRSPTHRERTKSVDNMDHIFYVKRDPPTRIRWETPIVSANYTAPKSYGATYERKVTYVFQKKDIDGRKKEKRKKKKEKTRNNKKKKKKKEKR